MSTPSYEEQLEQVAAKIEGKIKIVEEADKFYGGPDAERFESEVMESPTWADLVVVANRQIRTTGDKHHLYLENVRVIEENEDGVQIARLGMGS